MSSQNIKLKCLNNSGGDLFVVNAVSGISSTHTQVSSSSSTGSFVTFGGISINSSANAASNTEGGSFTVAGGGSIAKDLYIGGSLYVSNQNLTSVSGTTTIGSFSGTGVLTLNGISIGKTMSNTNYIVIGNLFTTTNNTNVYTVTFKNLTTSTFDAVVCRLDAWGSGWTDANLRLAWQVLPQ